MTGRHQHLANAYTELQALPDLIAELDGCLTEHGTQPEGGGGKPGKIAGSPAPLRLDVLHLTDRRRKPDTDPRKRVIINHGPTVARGPNMISTVHLRDTVGALPLLESWVRIVWEESDLTELADPPTVATETATLIAWWQWITEQQWADELADDVLHLAGRVRAALGRPKRPWPCPDCQWNLEAKGDADEHGRHILHACHGCGRIWRLKELQDRLDRLESGGPVDVRDAVTLAYAAKYVQRPPSTLREWVQCGDLEPLGFDRQRNARLFRLADVERLAEERPRHTVSRVG